MSEKKSSKITIILVVLLLGAGVVYVNANKPSSKPVEKSVENKKVEKKCLEQLEGKIAAIGLSEEVLNDAAKKKTTAKIKLVATNNSKTEYKFENNEGFNIGSYWKDAAGKSIFETRAVLKEGLKPDETKEYNLEFGIPTAAGKYQLVIAFVQEGCFWSSKIPNSTSFTTFDYEVKESAKEKAKTEEVKEAPKK